MATNTSTADPTKYGLHKAWGACPHVVSVSSTLQPASMQPARCVLTNAGSLVPAERTGYAVDYFDPLFQGTTSTQLNSTQLNSKAHRWFLHRGLLHLAPGF